MIIIIKSDLVYCTSHMQIEARSERLPSEKERLMKTLALTEVKRQAIEAERQGESLAC